MTSLKQLISSLEIKSFSGNLDIRIRKIRTDSRKVQKDDLFFAIEGFDFDGHDFIPPAIKNGAIAIVCQIYPKSSAKNITIIQVENSRIFLSSFSKKRYDSPDEKLIKIGITGTNGKTSTAYFLQQMLNFMKHPAGLIGTIIYDTGAYQKQANHTTPEAHILYELLDDMVNHGCTHVVMEVSSHALALNRVNTLIFERAIFTNFSHEHLDFHGSMDNYFNEKLKLFHSKLSGTAILNRDDERVRKIDCKNTMTFSIGFQADIKAISFLVTIDGLEFSIEKDAQIYAFKTKIVGRFNLSNILASICCLLSLNFPIKQIQIAVSKLKPISGRMEKHFVHNKHVIIDYAHTPDALESVLKACRTLTENRLICVFGCGGERDKDKRAMMGQTAEHYADHTFITSDNPRNEDPEMIIDHIAKGFKRQKYECESNRKIAIFKALEMASQSDLIIIAGKGHETYQEINKIRHPFNDAEIIYNWKTR